MAKAIQLKDQTTILYPLPYYPIGSIYTSYVSTSPASIYGGSWEQITDRFLLGAGSTYSAGATGGASTVSLSSSTTMRSHRHSFSGARATSGGSNYSYLTIRGNANSGAYLTSSYTGSGSAHQNMPAHMNVYMWKRTA